MKKVLFITYYWPPSGKASLHWPLKIIKHLPNYGWLPLVLTVSEDTFSQQDSTFNQDIPEKVKVMRAKSYEPFDVYKRLTGKAKDEQLIASETISKKNKSLTHRLSIWIRMNLFIPDARVGWYFPSVKMGSGLLGKEKIDAIVSIGPPHTTHLVGKKLASKFKLPHVPVFIDPWTDIAYYKEFKRNSLTRKIDNHLEKLVLQNSKAIVFVTKTMCTDYERKYPSIKNKTNVLYWGFSEEEFQGIEQKKKSDDEKVIVHAGNIFSYQNPIRLWQQIKNEIDADNKIKLKFIGTVDPTIVESINNAGIAKYTEYLGFLPYRQMLEEICNADFLLVCATEPRHVPGKLFEYLRAGKPIIAFGNDNNEVSNILTNANAGMIFSYEESAEKFFRSYSNLETNKEFVNRFERKEISKEMGNILNLI